MDTGVNGGVSRVSACDEPRVTLYDAYQQRVCHMITQSDTPHRFHLNFPDIASNHVISVSVPIRVDSQTHTSRQTLSPVFNP